MRYEYNGKIFKREDDVCFYILDNIGYDDLLNAFTTLLRGMDGWDFCQIWGELSQQLRDEVSDMAYKNNWNRVKKIEDEDEEVQTND